MQKETNEAVNKATSDHELRMRQLQDRLDAMDRQVTEVVGKNKEEEQRMRREKSRLESILNSKIVQFDEDMGSRTQMYNALTSSYTAEQQEYFVLKEHFDKIDADIGRYNEEEHLLSCVNERAHFGQRVIDNAATSIQKIFRGKQGRAVVAKIRAKLKKKGKKGKKDKGKK